MVFPYEKAEVTYTTQLGIPSQHPIQHQRDFLEIIQAVYPEEIWIGMMRIWSIIYICYFFTSKFIALITSTNSY